MDFLTCLLAAVMVINAGFEDVAKNGKPMGWKLPADMRVVRGDGHNGSAGLVWESTEPSVKRSAATQTFDIEPGRQYRFSALLRAEGFTSKKGAKIDASFLDATGKPVAEQYPRGVRSSCDWTRVEGLLDAPTNAVKMRLYLSVLPKSRGKVCFDDVLVEPEDREVAIHAFSSAYRDVATSGPVALYGFVFLPPGVSVGDAEASFVCRDAAGAEKRLPAVLTCETPNPSHAAEVYATASTTTEDLAEGRQSIRFEVRTKAGKELGATAFDFCRARTLPQRRVWIDTHGRCIVNGAPFFPIGMYAHKMSDEDAAVYASGPFNSVVVYGLSDASDLQRLAKHGIWYVPTLKNEIVGRRHAADRGIRTQAQSDAFFRGEIAKLKDQPNLLAWYVCDEAPLTELEARQHLYAIYRECDDNHPCWAVMDKMERMREWMSICDVYGVDPYPICGRPMSRISNFCTGTRLSTRGVRAFWNVPQNFNWAWYGRAETQGVPNRMPTTEELTFINWCHIAGGANGLFGYTFSSIRQEKGRSKRADFDKHWQSICTAYADVKRLSPVLLSVEPTPPAPAVSTDTPVRLWRKDGKLYVLACNATKDPVTLSIPLGGANALDGMEFGNQKAVAVKDGVLTVTLPPTGYAMARFNAEGSGKTSVNKWAHFREMREIRRIYSFSKGAFRGNAPTAKFCNYLTDK